MPSNRRWSIQAQLRCVPPVILLGHLVLATCALAVLLGALLAARHPALSLPGGERRLATHSTIIAGAAPRRSLSADPLPTFNVSAHPVGYGAIELSPTGPYTVGQVITAFADPANGWQFDHWSGVVSGAQNPFTFTVSANAELTATFVSRSEAGIFNVVTSVVGGGEVVMTPGGPFVGGQSTLLTALPHVGWKFERWSGDIGSNQNPVALLVNGDTEVIALFALVSPIPTLTLAVDTSGQGMVTVDPSGPYVTGQPITLTAVAASGWDFAGWGAGLTGSTNPMAMTIITNMVVTANFTPLITSQQLTVTVAVQGEGQVESFPAGPYEQGQLVTLTASAQPGWRFAGWRGDQRSPLNPYSFAIQKATTLTATFEPLELTLGVVGNGTVWRDPPGPYMVGQRITVTAQPAAGWKFAGWNGDQNGLSNPHSFAMQSATVLTATFVPLDIALTVVGQGSVERNPPSPYAAGQTITLTAQAANGWKFIGWSGDLAGSQNPYSLILTQSLAVTATFTQIGDGSGLTLALSTHGGGGIDAQPPPPYHAGQQVSLTAIAAPGQCFQGWIGGLTSQENPQRLTLLADQSVTAQFGPCPLFLPVIHAPSSIEKKS